MGRGSWISLLCILQACGGTSGETGERSQQVPPGQARSEYSPSGDRQLSGGGMPAGEGAPEGKGSREGRSAVQRLPGEDQGISREEAERGKVLVAYSDCYTCHREDKDAKGPAFRDIAARYPANDTYIGMLAARVIQGGSGAWGYAVMSPHPKLSPEDAATMVRYVLSLDSSRKIR